MFVISKIHLLPHKNPRHCSVWSLSSKDPTHKWAIARSSGNSWEKLGSWIWELGSEGAQKSSVLGKPKCRSGIRMRAQSSDRHWLHDELQPDSNSATYFLAAYKWRWDGASSLLVVQQYQVLTFSCVLWLPQQNRWCPPHWVLGHTVRGARSPESLNSDSRHIYRGSMQISQLPLDIRFHFKNWHHNFPIVFRQS